MTPFTADLSNKYSRKTWLWAGLFLIPILVGLVWFPPKLARKNSVPDKTQIVSSAQNNLLLDPDHDGLANWEEQLYGTDPYNPDTDGDGTPDGEEIKQGRDPLVPGPNDALIKSDQPANPENQNLTQNIFEEFMQSGGAAALLQQGSNPANLKEAVTKKVDSFLKSGVIAAHKPQIQPAVNLNVKPDNSQAAIEKYFNSLGQILDKYAGVVPEKDDLDLFLEITNSGQTDRLKELAPYQEAMEKMAAELRTLEVPKGLEDFHAKEVGFLEESAKQLKILENVDKDPAAALAVIPARIDLKIEIARFHTEIEQELNNKS